MISSHRVSSPLAELESLNRELASLFACEPASLSGGSEAALRDELILCGVLGGKNVGKSTLINALARRSFSVDHDAGIRGTDRPVVYVHEDVREQAALRLRPIASLRELEFVSHDADEIRHLVLIDLPDFDSEFRQHVEIARQTAPLLDRIIWVATPRKLGDRAWLEMLGGVIKHARNVHCVLNKVDELLTDADPFVDEAESTAENTLQGSARNGSPAVRFLERYDNWLAHVSSAAGCVHESTHRFLTAAAFADEGAFVRHISHQWEDPKWAQFGRDKKSVSEVGANLERNLDRLRGAVLAPLSSDEIHAIKQSNQQAELSVLHERVRAHYELDRTIGTLRDLNTSDYADHCLCAAFDESTRMAMVGAVASRVRPERSLADELLEHRVDAWPLLRVVHWPLGWLARAVGRRVDFAPTGAGRDRRDVLAANELGLFDRIELVRCRILADLGMTLERLQIEREIPSASRIEKRLARTMGELPQNWESDLLSGLRAQYRRASIVGRAMLWFVTLWFPLIQPIAAGLLEMFVETGTVHLAHGAYRLVTALSAAHLLAGFGVVAGIYVAMLAAMYTRSLRAVRRALDDDSLQGGLESRIDDVLMRNVLGPLLQPFADRFEKLSAIDAQLSALSTKAQAA